VINGRSGFPERETRPPTETASPVIETAPFLVILASALLHAVWNALARSSPTPGDIMACGVMAAGVLSLPALLLAGLPEPAVLPWLLGGIAINSVGIRAAMAAYQRTSYGLAYPIMRAGIPLLALPIAIVLFGEWPSPGRAFGVFLISLALILLALVAWRAGRAHLSGVGFALLASLCGAGYVAADAMGVRLSANVWSYAFAVSVGNALMLALMVRVEGRNPIRLLAANARLGFGISLLSTSSFLLYVWALRITPVAPAAALRETSVLFATAIAAFVLKEHVGPLHWLAAVMALAGIAAIRLF
jgi:drug/metabolite transporter (DMT)-like permease